jgi:GDPmannose 4,6-dehydratase
MMKRALICGVSGQDGAFLAQFLLLKGYEVWGTSRDAQGSRFKNLRRLSIFSRVKKISMSVEDFRSVYMAIEQSKPDEVYFLAGQSSVGLSFDLPAETIQSILYGALNILEVCRLVSRPMKLYLAGSSECFGDTSGKPADESTPFDPKSPYAVAKASAFWLANSYRDSYDIFACTGILFNHESFLRPERFVTQKIVQAAIRISKGSAETLELGRLDIARDWGWAPDYVEAMWLMLQQKSPENYVVASGKTSTLESFVEQAFTTVNLNWRDHVVQNPLFHRPNEVTYSCGNPSLINANLNWAARTSMPEVVDRMIEGSK